MRELCILTRHLRPFRKASFDPIQWNSKQIIMTFEDVLTSIHVGQASRPVAVATAVTQLNLSRATGRRTQRS
jgi:hypothetical protein